MNTISDFFEPIFVGIVEDAKECFNEVAKDEHRKYYDDIQAKRSDFISPILALIATAKRVKSTSARATKLEERVNEILDEEKVIFDNADPKKTLKASASLRLGAVSVIAGIAVAIFASLSIGTGLAFAGVGLFLFGYYLVVPLINVISYVNSELEKCLPEAEALQMELLLP